MENLFNVGDIIFNPSDDSHCDSILKYKNPLTHFKILVPKNYKVTTLIFVREFFH